MVPSDVVLAGSPQLLPHVFSRLITGLLLSHCLSTASRGGFDCRVLLYCDARQQHLGLPLLASSGTIPVCWIPAGALTSSRMSIPLVAPGMSLSMSWRPAPLSLYTTNSPRLVPDLDYYRTAAICWL